MLTKEIMQGVSKAEAKRKGNTANSVVWRMERKAGVKQ